MMLRVVVLFLALSLPAFAQESVVVGLSEDRVSITANFDGSEILVFGAVRRDAPPPAGPPLDVIVTVEGPRSPVDVRHKSRVAGIWINTEAALIDAAPSFYAVASTGPLAEVLAEDEDARHRISVARRIGNVLTPPGTDDPPRFSQALIRLRGDADLYREEGERIALAEETLFAKAFALPANLTEGAYEVRIYLARGGQVLDAHSTVLRVHKVGLEQFLYTLAHRQPMVYGLLALAIAVVAGWGASVFFRMLRS